MIRGAVNAARRLREAPSQGERLIREGLLRAELLTAKDRARSQINRLSQVARRGREALKCGSDRAHSRLRGIEVIANVNPLQGWWKRTTSNFPAKWGDSTPEERECSLTR